MLSFILKHSTCVKYRADGESNAIPNSFLDKNGLLDFETK